MRRLPDVVVIVDANHEMTVIKEANRLEIPVVAIVDSNTDPRPVDYPIPANDDSIRAIQLIISAIADGIIAAKESLNAVDESTPELDTVDKDEESDYSQNVEEVSESEDEEEVSESEDEEQVSESEEEEEVSESEDED